MCFIDTYDTTFCYVHICPLLYFVIIPTPPPLIIILKETLLYIHIQYTHQNYSHVLCGRHVL